MKGIDLPIEDLKNIFNEYLWNNTDFIAYGRAFPNEVKEGTLPEIMINGKREYIEKLTDSSKSGHCFFLPKPERPVTNGSQKAIVGIYFAVNLEKLYEDAQERATEYVHAAVINEMKTSDFDVTAIVTGIDAFKGLAYLRQDLMDMQPFYLFRIDAEVKYNTNCN
jgi:hypothetical protein